MTKLFLFRQWRAFAGSLRDGEVVVSVMACFVDGRRDDEVIFVSADDKGGSLSVSPITV
jgi:hypothetical protein